jgi:hypothetical protein
MDDSAGWLAGVKGLSLSLRLVSTPLDTLAVCLVTRNYLGPGARRPRRELLAELPFARDLLKKRLTTMPVDRSFIITRLPQVTQLYSMLDLTAKSVFESETAIKEMEALRFSFLGRSDSSDSR